MQTFAKTKTSNKTQIDSGWNVVVYDDDEHTDLFVVCIFCNILGLSIREAIGLVDEIESCGQAVVAGPMSQFEAHDIYNKLKNCKNDPHIMNKDIVSNGLYAKIEKA